MKNTNIKNLDKVIPKRIRFSVYKEALKLLEDASKLPSNSYDVYGMGTRNDNLFGLCLLLPCILWNLENYCHPAPDNTDWDWYNTSFAFPEIAKGVKLIMGSSVTQKAKFRIKVLKDILKKEAK